MKDADIPDGYHWLDSERTTLPSIAQKMMGRWYLIAEAEPVDLAHIERRGWRYAGPVKTPKRLLK